MSTVQDTVTPQEAATLLGVDIRTIRDWIRQGMIEAIRLPGNRRRIPRSALHERMVEATRPAKTNVSKLTMKRFCHGFEVPQSFDLITTYEELSQYTEAFGNQQITFLLLVGSPGSGKSRQMKGDLGRRNHVWIDNHTTNLGLYCSVYEANGVPLVLDDINHLFKSKMACSLMKALTQTEKARSVSWESTTQLLDMRNIPRQFKTSSPICLIANQWNGSDADMAAIQDRALPVAFYPSAETIHKQVMKQGWCDQEICIFIGQHLAGIPQPSMREYFQAMSYRNAGMNWREKLMKIWGTT